jgi:hypothetical protein
MPTDARGRLGRFLLSRDGRSRVGGVGGKDFGEGDRRWREFRGIEGTEERTGKASDEGGSDVVWVSFNHERVVLDTLFAQLEITQRVAE